jgi:hypothetical protein
VRTGDPTDSVHGKVVTFSDGKLFARKLALLQQREADAVGEMLGHQYNHEDSKQFYQYSDDDSNPNCVMVNATFGSMLSSASWAIVAVDASTEQGQKADATATAIAASEAVSLSHASFGEAEAATSASTSASASYNTVAETGIGMSFDSQDAVESHKGGIGWTLNGSGAWIDESSAGERFLCQAYAFICPDPTAGRDVDDGVGDEVKTHSVTAAGTGAAGIVMSAGRLTSRGSPSSSEVSTGTMTVGDVHKEETVKIGS